MGQGGFGKKKTDAGREMFIREMGSTGSSSTGALVATGSLQPSIAAPMLSTAPADLQRSLEFQSSILVVDLENEVRV